MHRTLTLILLLAAPGCVAPTGCPTPTFGPDAVELIPTTTETCGDLLGLPVVLPDCGHRTWPQPTACEITGALTCQSGGDRPPGAHVEVIPSAPLVYTGDGWEGEGEAVATVGRTGETCSAPVRIIVR